MYTAAGFQLHAGTRWMTLCKGVSERMMARRRRRLRRWLEDLGGLRAGLLAGPTSRRSAFRDHTQTITCLSPNAIFNIAKLTRLMPIPWCTDVHSQSEHDAARTCSSEVQPRMERDTYNSALDQCDE
jgi:hypothetical protein